MKKSFWFIIISAIICFYFNAYADDEHITRAEMAETIMSFYEQMNNSNQPVQKSPVEFIDVQVDNHLKNSILQCVYMGYMVGTGDNTFEPNEKVTRAQAATIFDRLVEELSNEHCIEKNIWFDLDRFNDESDFPQWSYKSIYEMQHKGYLHGDENNNFLPGQYITTQQVNSVLDRISSYKIENTSDYASDLFNSVFKFVLPHSAKIVNYSYMREFYANSDLYEQIYIAKISFDKEDLEYIKKQFYLDTLDDEYINELDYHFLVEKLWDVPLSAIKNQYSWWDLPKLDQLEYKYVFYKRGAVVQGISNYIFISKMNDEKYNLYVSHG